MASSFDRPLIVLHQGTSPSHDYVYNTAYWTGWGTEKQNMRDQIITKDLPWAAEGVRVTKSCDVSCYVTDSQGLAPMADAIMMEIINHPRSFGDAPINWPRKKADQLWGMFYYEPSEQFSSFLSPEVLDHFDFTVTPKQDSDMPITLICPWGRNPQAYLSPPPSKHAGAPVCDFLGHVPPGYHGLLESLRDHIKVDSFGGPWKNADAPEPFNLPNRIRHVGQYKFALVTESTIEVDWIGPELSQAWLAGTVPIYIGAPNVDEFVPGEHSIIKATDFESGEALANYLKHLLDNEDEYKKYFAWKEQGLSPSFERHLENCAHLAECRICHHVRDAKNLA
eukprot:CAMPEP_0206200910 /NCGR_PEP_ID=MMETSP0166-20121206/11191_1 /ASSEMBLY_ACC=CAM_ASM_000260 /TAXON_ID=95228 /ORGANISM="Vannella robusta, Strain DIVA3 518/3/11/1/6" /LENGTH=336 /DNA_ID=CAMNT_0053619399 /DNA_START=128 /DNA_END=1138 /DNA_ORIENTATION=+